MTLQELLQERKDAIASRWLGRLLATYPEDAAAVYRRRGDLFANPVGAGLRAGTRGVVEALFNGADDESLGRHLDEIIRVRAVQQFSPSQAVGFVFHLKEVLRAELGDAAGAPRFLPELAEFDERIDRIALAAFDLFVQYREQVCELRVNEAKRRVSWVMEKLHQRGVDLESAGNGGERAQRGRESPRA